MIRTCRSDLPVIRDSTTQSRNRILRPLVRGSVIKNRTQCKHTSNSKSASVSESPFALALSSSSVTSFLSSMYWPNEISFHLTVDAAIVESGLTRLCFERFPRLILKSMVGCIYGAKPCPRSSLYICICVFPLGRNLIIVSTVLSAVVLPVHTSQRKLCAIFVSSAKGNKSAS